MNLFQIYILVLIVVGISVTWYTAALSQPIFSLLTTDKHASPTTIWLGSRPVNVPARINTSALKLGKEYVSFKRGLSTGCLKQVFFY